MKKKTFDKVENGEAGAAAVAPASGRSKASFSEIFAKVIFIVCAVFSIVAVLTIVFYLLGSSFPALRKIGLFNFLFGRIWNNDKGLTNPSEYFGILPAIVSSLVVTAGAVVVGGILGICSAIFMVYYCPKKVKGIYTQFINLLAGIPSVIYGFVGLETLVPFFRETFNTPMGMGPLPAILVLSLMITPTVASLARNSIESVPKEYYEGALAMGNTKAQAIFNVCVPAAKKGIFAALILGVGRAVGETMAVQMVIGNSVNYFPTGPFQGVVTLTTLIVQNMAYADGILLQTLLAVCVVLLFFILLINIGLTLLQRERKSDKGSLFHKKLREQAEHFNRTHEFRACGTVPSVLKYVCVVFAWVLIAVLAAIVVYICIRGIPNLTVHFVFGEANVSYATLRAAGKSTLLIVLMTLVIALPLGIGAAIYLNEYSKKGSKFVKVIRLFVDTLSGIPSIVFGLFGLTFFVDQVIGHRCLLAGSFTMVLIILPTIIRSTEESLREVPDSMREASLALGASKVRTVFRIVLPAALSGIVTAIILSIGRIVGESAALIYTTGATNPSPDGYLSPGLTFAVLMYNLSSSGVVDEFGQTSLEKTYATAFVLLLIVAVLNFLVTFLEKKIKKKVFGDAGGSKAAKKAHRAEAAAEESSEATPASAASVDGAAVVLGGEAAKDAGKAPAVQIVAVKNELPAEGEKGKQTI